MLAEALVLVALPLLLAAAAGWDLASFTIPNFLQGALLAVFLVFIVAAGLSWNAIGFHFLAGLVGLIIGFIFGTHNHYFFRLPQEANYFARRHKHCAIRRRT